MQVAVVAKDALMREGIQSLIANEGRMNVVGNSDQISHAARLLGGSGVLIIVAENLQADDWIQLGESRSNIGLRVALVERPENPIGGFKVADVVVRSSDGSMGLLNAVRRLAGVPEGYVAAAQPTPMLVKETILAGSYGGKRGLSRREFEVAKLVAQGMSNRKISQVLDLQEQSIKNLVSSIMRKLQCGNRVQVALKLTGSPTVTEDEE